MNSSKNQDNLEARRERIRKRQEIEQFGTHFEAANELEEGAKTDAIGTLGAFRRKLAKKR
jgi:hypothetical protein